MCVKDGVMGVMNEEEKHTFLLTAFGPARDTGCPPVALESASDCSEEKADHKYARLRPAGSRPTALLPCNATTVGGGVIFFFFFPFHFLSPLHRKETRCRCLGNGTGGLQSSEAD